MPTPEPGPPILGLDLGTSTCLACVIHEGKPLFVRPDLHYEGFKLDRPAYPSEVMPSAFWHQHGTSLVGHRALEKQKDPASARDIAFAVKQAMHLDEEGGRLITLGGRPFRPSQILSEYVHVLVHAAELELDLKRGTIKKAVVTVPAGFGELAQKATIRACTEFGPLREVELVDEPVAAAYSLGLHEHPSRLRVLIVDIGGGTFDLTLWDVGRGVGPLGFRELGRGGDTRLGGLSWDKEIADSALRGLRPRLPRDGQERLLHDLYDYGHTRLFRACEDAKLIASLQMKRNALADPLRPLDHRLISPLAVSFRSTHEEGADDLSVDVPSGTFLTINERLLGQCDVVCDRLFGDVAVLLKRERFGWADVDRVYLAGGGSRLPAVQRRFAERWGKAPLLDDDPQHSVAKGAAMLAELWRQGTSLPGVIGRTRYARNLGVLVWPHGRDGEPKFYTVIPRNVELPFNMSRTFPVRGGTAIRRVEIQFAEQENHHDKADYVDLITLALEDPPPAPAADQNETARVTIRCGLNPSPTFHIEFRDTSISGALDQHVRRERAGSPRDGRTPPPTYGTADAHADRPGPNGFRKEPTR